MDKSPLPELDDTAIRREERDHGLLIPAIDSPDDPLDRFGGGVCAADCLMVERCDRLRPGQRQLAAFLHSLVDNGQVNLLAVAGLTEAHQEEIDGSKGLLAAGTEEDIVAGAKHGLDLAALDGLAEAICHLPRHLPPLAA